MMQGSVTRYISELTERGGLKGIDIANIAEVSPAPLLGGSLEILSLNPETNSYFLTSTML